MSRSNNAVPRIECNEHGSDRTVISQTFEPITIAEFEESDVIEEVVVAEDYSVGKQVGDGPGPGDHVGGGGGGLSIGKQVGTFNWQLL